MKSLWILLARSLPSMTASLSVNGPVLESRSKVSIVKADWKILVDMTYVMRRVDSCRPKACLVFESNHSRNGVSIHRGNTG